MAVGIPVVASGVGMNANLVSHGVNGYLAHSDEEWIEYLSLLIEDLLRRQTMGMRGRKFVEENYDHRVHFKALHQFLSSL
jgi:glycosyltransferase involved in cell wall biosynthesis